jgi:RND family efflux transporter MFP subunit
MNVLRRILQIVLPLVVLAGGLLLAWTIANRPAQPNVQPAADARPFVRTARPEPLSGGLDVTARGTVEPLRTVELTAQVSGRVISVHANLRAGGALAADEVAVTIEPFDYEAAVAREEAAVARAELRVLQERAEREAALAAWRAVEGEREPEPLLARTPQLREAEAALAAAVATLEKSRLDLERTRLRAPFAARVRSAAVEVGQVVQPGQRLVTLFDAAEVEVRLPVPVADLAFVQLPRGGEEGPAVVLTGEFAGGMHSWPARIVRSEGELDRRTRLLTLVARATQPTDGAPLLPGAFVTATIAGEPASGAASPAAMVLPRAALRGADRFVGSPAAAAHVWVVERGEHAGAITHRLRRRGVEVLRIERDRAVLRSGVTATDDVVLTDLDTPTDGLAVRLHDGGER